MQSLMKLLIVTQVVDLDHPILGFFHHWLLMFAAQCESVEVVCLQEGRHDLPSNVTVYSLGKESGVSRFLYIYRFYKYIWQLRRKYDSVFVHMNQVYVLLGWLPWLLLNKRVCLWYMHGSVSPSLSIASRLVHRIFTGSPESFRLQRSNVYVTGHGIDTTRFRPDIPATFSDDMVTVGRITASKNLAELFHVLAALTDVSVTLTIIGAAVTKQELEYESHLRQLAIQLELQKRIIWYGRVEQSDLPDVLRRHRVFVTSAQNGSLDKAILEALACGLPVVSSAPGSQSLPLQENQVRNRDEFVSAVQSVLADQPDTTKLVLYVQESHSLDKLVTKIIETY